MAKNIFVVCEQRDNKIQNVSLELLGVANELAAVTKEKVCAVVLGDKIKEAAKELAGYGADIIYVVEDKELKYYLTEQYSQAVYQVLKTYEPNIVLYGATSIGRDLAPRLSARLRTGLTADCTKLEADAQAYAIQAVQKQLETSPNYIDYDASRFRRQSVRHHSVPRPSSSNVHRQRRRYEKTRIRRGQKGGNGGSQNKLGQIPLCGFRCGRSACREIRGEHRRR